MDQTPEDLARDQQDIDAALQGDEAAFRRLVEKYQNFLFNLCRRVVQNRQDALDLTQETFLKFHTHLKDYKRGQKLSNWLYTIALNECRKQLRRRRIVQFFSLREDEDSLDPEARDLPADQKATQDQSKKIVEKLVADLPEPLRIPFVLRYFQELTDEEIVQVTGLSLSNVRVRIHRARHYLWEKHGELIKEIL